MAVHSDSDTNSDTGSDSGSEWQWQYMEHEENIIPHVVIFLDMPHEADLTNCLVIEYISVYSADKAPVPTSVTGEVAESHKQMVSGHHCTAYCIRAPLHSILYQCNLDSCLFCICTRLCCSSANMSMITARIIF